MKRFALGLVIALLSVSVANAQPKENVRVAPADEYFGRLKMSILGIGNVIRDQTKKYDVRPDLLDSELGAVRFAVDAIKDWEQKYPDDPWIAKTLFSLERFYNRIPSDECREQARSTMVWLVRDFPDTWYGRVGKRELAEGRVGNSIGAPVAAATVEEPAK
ncbi:MAG: hypothetical protein ACRENA_14985 [Vulcanimicrobiaceae bacterium]